MHTKRGRKVEILTLDVGRRWNSKYKMLKKACKEVGRADTNKLEVLLKSLRTSSRFWEMLRMLRATNLFDFMHDISWVGEDKLTFWKGGRGEHRFFDSFHHASWLIDPTGVCNTIRAHVYKWWSIGHDWFLQELTSEEPARREQEDNDDTLSCESWWGTRWRKLQIQ